MPMIDVYARADLFPAGVDRQLGEELTMAVLRAEGVAAPGPFHLNNTAAYIHRMEPAAVQTAATDSARTVRVQIITPPAAVHTAATDSARTVRVQIITPPAAVHTAATDSARTVRVQIITPPAALTRAGQKQLVKEVTEIVTRISRDPTQAGRTWVLLTEAAEGGWGLSGTAFGREEFAALAAKAAAARGGK